MRVFALSVGATALCMLVSWSYLEPRPQEALEASVFNGSQGYQATTSAAPSGEAPGQVVPLGSAFGIKLFAVDQDFGPCTSQGIPGAKWHSHTGIKRGRKLSSLIP